MVLTCIDLWWLYDLYIFGMCTNQKHLFGHLDISRLILISYITTLPLVLIAIFEAFPPRLNHICSPHFLLALPYILHIISIIHYIADISRPSTKNRKLESVTVMLLILFCWFLPIFPDGFCQKGRVAAHQCARKRSWMFRSFGGTVPLARPTWMIWMIWTGEPWDGVGYRWI